MTLDPRSARAGTPSEGYWRAMQRAVELADGVRRQTGANPWVGCVITPGGFEGATQPPGGPHAETVALEAAGEAARGATLVCTLEPCVHTGRTGPCVDAIVAAGISRVVAAIVDPDPRVAGKGFAALRAAGVEVEVGLGAAEVRAQLAPYLKHRATGRPYVVLKLAATLDGRTAAPDGTSKWITGEEARADVHRLRADSGAILVGAGTVRADDPALTARGVDAERQPLRVVLGAAPAGARVRPALELKGDPGAVLDELGGQGVLQLLIEGGATVAGQFHRAGLVDRYVLYLAPALLGGDDGRPVLAGPGTATMADVWRGRIVAVTRLGADVRIDLEPLTGPVFTGIVEELGRFTGRDGLRFTFEAPVTSADAAVGDSIAVNGVCLTVVALDGSGSWQADVVDETLARTNLGRLAVGDPVNLERPLRLSDRLDGHLVQGHVDSVGEVVDAAPGLRIRAAGDGLRYVAPKGSIAVDGVSLTVVDVLDDGFTVAVIPHTAAVTTLSRRRPGDAVNLEFDVIAKYVARLLGE